MRNVLIFICAFIPFALKSQCYQERHNTSWNEAWISCEKRANPNTDRGSGHWILYDFGHSYRLGNAKIWNLNSPEFLESGIRDFYIDYSQDGMTWKNLGEFTLMQAPGESRYEGEDISGFGGDTARFVLLTAIDTHGGACAGISELKIDVIEVVSQLQVHERNSCFEASIYPNPHTDDFTLSLNSSCQGPVSYSLYDHTGKLIRKESFAGTEALMIRKINTTGLRAGLYHLLVSQKDAVERYPVMKIR